MREYALLPGIAGVGVGNKLKLKIIKIPTELSIPFTKKYRFPLNAEIIWRSSNPGVAKVSRRGVVTGISPGNGVIITVKIKIPGQPEIVLQNGVKVGPPVEKFNFNLNEEVMKFCKGIISIEPLSHENEYLKDRPIEWISRDPNIVSIEQITLTLTEAKIRRIISDYRTHSFEKLYQHGIFIKGNNIGTTELIAKCEDIIATITVQVTPSIPTSISLYKDYLEADIGQSMGQYAIVYNEGGYIDEDAIISWEIEDNRIAAIDGTLSRTCSITVITIGETKATASIIDGPTSTMDICVPPVGQLHISPMWDTISPGEEIQFVATVRSFLGHPLESRHVIWNVGDDRISIVEIWSGGKTILIKGEEPGTDYLYATCEEIVDQSRITVLDYAPVPSPGAFPKTIHSAP